ncbi:proton-coupled zinc antiporter SLC30A1 [Hoplias malabaricus]|uniref:proton-coupled zinc antiporter SLC30A1 n=1 Tax=Hoplias malabaricus TaxID=27720 RepID=UPI0034637494
MERSALWGSCTHRCLLAFTSALLLFEVVVGRLCRSLINTVDSFHTLYILIHLTMHPLETLTGATETSIANPYTSQDSDGPLGQNPTSTTDDPSVNPDSSQLPSPGETQIELTVAGTATASLPLTEDTYCSLRMQPFGAVIAALLLGSLCVSVTLEIITHILQPHVIQRPLLATVVGAVSLLFNSLILIWRGGRGMDGDDGLSKDMRETQNEVFTLSNDTGTTTNLEASYHCDSSTSEGPLQGGMLMFCNPTAPSVLDPLHQCTKEHCSPTHSVENSISHESTDFQQPPQTLQLSHSLHEVDYSNACVGRMGLHVQVGRGPRRQSGYVKGILPAIHSLLGPVLVLANGLALLLHGVDCLQPRWDCHLLPYLDPGFCLVTVLVLMARALPELRYHAFMLLQAAPAHINMEDLTASIGRVQGVLAVHELHVWQLSAARLVASVHIHCQAGMGALECSKLLETVTEVLNHFGVSHCTVQPEFITMHSNTPQSSGTHSRSVPDTVDSTVQPLCSLRCGKECARKMCCSPPDEEHLCPALPPTVETEVREQDVVIENSHL